MTTDLWFGTSGRRDAAVMIVGEAWGAEESNQQQPFVGESGRELDRMLAEAGIERKDCFATNIVPARPPGNELYKWFVPTKEARSAKLPTVNGLYPSERIQIGLNNLYAQIEAIKPKLIIGCGNYPFWALSSNVRIDDSKDPSGWKIPGGIATWRGSQLLTDVGARGFRYLPIYHPAGILRNWSTRAITVHDLRVRTPLALRHSWSKPSKLYIAPPSFSEATRYLGQMLRRLDNSSVSAAVDIETKGPTIACIGLSHDGLSAICIPFLVSKEKGTIVESYWPFDQEIYLVKMLRAVLNHPNLFIIGQYFAYDVQYLTRWWHTLPRCGHDTYIAQHVLFPGTPKSLDYLASLYNKVFYRFWKEDSKEWEETSDLATHLRYNCDDCFETWNAYHCQVNALKQTNKVGPFNHKMEEWLLAVEMMNRGVLIDKAVRSELSDRVADEAQKRVNWLKRVVPEWVLPDVKKGAKPWYSSAIQQRRFFYEELGLKTVHHRVTGNPSVDDTSLEEIKLRYPEFTQIADTILELRSLGVFQNNFLHAALDPDGRMRCFFNPGGTDTMRWSSSKNAFRRGTNLQNIPMGDEEL